MKLKMMIAVLGTVLCMMGTYESANAQYGGLSGNINVRFGNGGYYGGQGYGYNNGYYGRGRVYQDRYHGRGHRQGYYNRGYRHGRGYGHGRYSHVCRHHHAHHRGCGPRYSGYGQRGW